MLRIGLKILFNLIGLITVGHGCLPSGVRGCDCAAQPNCGPCSPVSQSFSYDNAYQQQPSGEYQQSAYQAPPAQYQPPLPPPPPQPPAPEYQPQPPVQEYQPPNIYLPGISNSAAAAPPAPSTSSQGQYPSQQYLHMLDLNQAGSNELPQQPSQPQEASTPEPPQASQQPPQNPVTPKVESYHETIRNIIVGVSPNGKGRIDQTAYRENYRSENSESVARFESGSIKAPPPEDPPTEDTEENGSDDYTQEIQPMTLPIQKLPSPTTQTYPSPTPTYTFPVTTTTIPPTAGIYKHSSQEYAAVLKEPLEDRKPDPFFTYNNQVCTGIVIIQAKETSVADAARKCMQMNCAAANIHASSDGNEDEFDVVYLKTADSRKDNNGFYCISVSNIPTFGNDFDKIENEIKLHKKEGKTSDGTTSFRFERLREVSHDRRRAPSSFNAQATTFRPRIFRFATIEPKSSY